MSRLFRILFYYWARTLTPSHPHTLTTVKFPYERELCLLLPGLAWLVVSIVYHDILNITLS